MLVLIFGTKPGFLIIPFWRFRNPKQPPFGCTKKPCKLPTSTGEFFRHFCHLWRCHPLDHGHAAYPAIHFGCQGCKTSWGFGGDDILQSQKTMWKSMIYIYNTFIYLSCLRVCIVLEKDNLDRIGFAETSSGLCCRWRYHKVILRTLQFQKFHQTRHQLAQILLHHIVA